MSLFPRSARSCIPAGFALALTFAFAPDARAGFGVGPTNPVEPIRPPAVRNQDQVAAADNGAVSLFVWRDTRRGDADLVAARVRHDGTVLDPNGIDLASGAGAQQEPAVAWDGTQWLVAWTDVQGADATVKAMRVSSAGALLDPAPTDLSTPGAVASHPAVAWNGALHIVLWSELSGASTRQVMGATIDNGGAVRASVAVVSGGTTDDQPAAAATGANALVAFRSSRAGNADIYAVRVTAALPAGTITRLDATDFALVSQTDPQESPAVASSGSAWLVAWEDARNRNSTGIDPYATRVTAGGVVQDPAGIQLTNTPGTERQLALTHDGSQWLATWTGFGGQFLRAIANNGNPAPGVILVAYGVVPPGDGAFGGAADHPFVAWSDTSASHPSESDLHARRVGASLVLDPTFVIATQTPNQTEPAIAFGANHWLVAWVDDRFGPDQRQLRIGFTDSAKFEAPNPATIAFAVPREGLDQGHPTVAYDGTNFDLFWQESRGGHLSVQAARFTAGGALIDTFAVANGAWNQYEPTCAAFDDTVFVAWTDSRVGPTERDLWCATYAGNTVVHGPLALSNELGVREEHPKTALRHGIQTVTAYEVSSPSLGRGIRCTSIYKDLSFPYTQDVATNAGRTFDHPDIATNGEDLLITYQEIVFSDGPSLHVPFGVRFDGDNGNVWPFALQLAPGSYTPANPAVGSAGYDYVALWSTLNGGGPDVLANTFEQEGQAVSPTPLRLNSDPIIDTPGAVAQGQGDRVGLTYLRAFADSTWNGLRLFGGDARDTLRGVVVINEFLAHPSQGHPEFVEVFNTSGRSFLLNGWTLRVDGQPHVLDDCFICIECAKTPGRKSTFGTDPGTLGTVCSLLPSHDFFTFNDTTLTDIPEDPIEGHLPDRGAVLELFSPGGVLVDRVGYGYKGGAPVSGAIPMAIAPAAVTPPGVPEARGGATTDAVGDSLDLSTARLPNGVDTGNNANDFNLTGTTTPNTANTGTTSALGTALFVTRAYWNPSTGEEAVELYNPSTTTTFDFTNWYLSNNSATERIGVDGSAFSQLKPQEKRVLRRGERDSFSFHMDELSVLYLMAPDLTRYEQLGWSRPDQIAPDQCVTRVPDTGGFHDGFDWFTCGGQENIAFGELRYATCGLNGVVTDVPSPGPSRLGFAGMWPNPATAGRAATLVFTAPGAAGDAPQRARLSLYDVAGRRVATVFDQAVSPGEHRVPLVAGAGRVLRAGTYYADLEIGGARMRRTIVFLN